MPNHSAERLGMYLTVMEDIIRGELAPLARHRGMLWRGERKQLQLLDLKHALEAVAKARAELARCPEGAALAEYVLSAALGRLRLKAESADLRYQGSLKGAAAAKTKQQRRTK